MLEDCVMEKKSSRSVLPLGKGNGSESKKNQDGGVGKSFPRSARRRENPGPPAPSKHDPIRKQNPQKSKAFDKRPRPRGPYMASGTAGSQVGESEAEYGSVFSPGSKKHNLNHLLNFHYAPRQSVQSHQWRSGGAGGCPRFLLGSYPHKYNKEQFLQANCQFVVKAGADYRQYLCNPDQLVDWDHIEQIRVISAEVPSCPICLYPPVAAKMTRCGHVFCWSCILHYLALSDTAWRKCPICYEAVHKKDLKSVMAMATKSYDVGDMISLRLMRREKGSLQVIPVEQYELWPKRPLLSVAEKVDTAYAKLLLADPIQVMEILKRERSELEAQLEAGKDTEEVCFVESALTLLADRVAASQVLDLQKGLDEKAEEAAVVLGGASSPTAEEPCFEGDYLFGVADEELESSGAKEARERQDSGSSEEGNNVTSEDLEPSSSQQPVKTFYFYQAADGQHIYLHGLNARMLELGYGSLDRCPPTLTARIVEKEAGTMTEELRRRLRHLQHLPITCPFEVAEVRLSPPIIPDFAVDAYRDQVEIRERKRAKRAAEERRRERKINEEENRRWGRKPSPRIRIGSHVQFPTCGTGSSPPIGDVSKSPSMSSVASSASRSPARSPARSPVNLSLENLSLYSDAVPLSESASSKDNGRSFAQMLRTASTVPSWGPRPGAPSPQTYTSVTGASVAPRTALRPRRNSDSDAEPDAEAAAHAPSYSQSFAESISRAMAQHSAAAVSSSPEADHPLPGQDQPRGKKKKNKCKVLFVTARACSGK